MQDLWTPVKDEHELFVPGIYALWHYVRHCRSILGSPHPSDLPAPFGSLEDVPLASRSELDFGEGEGKVEGEGEGGAKGWDGQAVQRHMDTFMLDFVKHIPLEADVSSPENMRKAKPKDITKLHNEILSKSFWSANMHVYLPIFLSKCSRSRARSQVLISVVNADSIYSFP